MPEGKIVKSIAGFYEVYSGGEVYRCRARGVFRQLGEKPLVGDDVIFDITDTVSVPMEGNVVSIMKRKSVLQRPNVSNVDQALLLFAVRFPDPSFNMLDRFLISVSLKGLPVILCFNKCDLAGEEEISALRRIYCGCGSDLLFISTRQEDSLDELKSVLAGKTTVLAGPSGAGKSSLIRTICPGAMPETGELSARIGRGRNTTRATQIYAVSPDTFLMDTPGFTSIYLQGVAADDLKGYYPEFDRYAPECRFDTCMHYREPGCAVKMAVRDKVIPAERYQNYIDLYAELKERKPVYD